MTPLCSNPLVVAAFCIGVAIIVEALVSLNNQRTTMNNKPVSARDGKFSASITCQIQCPKCKNQEDNARQQWDSSCGGYTDFRMTCWDCGHEWWIEGSDS